MQDAYRDPLLPTAFSVIAILIWLPLMIVCSISNLNLVAALEQEPFQFYQGNAVVENASRRSSDTVLLRLDNGDYLKINEPLLDYHGISLTRADVIQGDILFEDIPFYYTAKSYFGGRLLGGGNVGAHTCVTMASESVDAEQLSSVREYFLTEGIAFLAIGIVPVLFLILLLIHIWKKHKELYRNPYARR